MKKIVFFFILITKLVCFSQIINIPDTNFKTLLLQSNNSNGVAGMIIDTNNNGEIEQSEAILVDYIYLPPGNISDLTGLEYFTNITSFGCPDNNISTLNLTTLIHLETLGLGGNQLSSLNLTGLTNLWFLNCGGNQLTAIDFSTLSALRIVQCAQNPYTILDFTNNPLFDQLSCSGCPNLTTIKIKNNRPQIFTQTPYNSCWDNNPNLNTICADVNEVNALQAFLTNCNITQPINIVTDCSLINENFADSNFSLAPNPTTGTIFFDNSKRNYKTGIIYNYLGQEILSKNLDSILNENLDLSSFENGVYFLKFSNEKESNSMKIIKE